MSVRTIWIRIKYSLQNPLFDTLAKALWVHHYCHNSISTTSVMARNETTYTSFQFKQRNISWNPDHCGLDFNPALSSVFRFFSPSVGRSLFRRKAFFIEKKLAHGQALTDQVFKSWVNAKLKISLTFESIELSNIDLQLDRWTALADAIISKKGERAVGMAKKPEFYARQHLNTGYPKVWSSIVEFLKVRKIYAELAISLVPLIRNRLQMEIQQRLPHLAEQKTLDKSELGYDFNLLFHKLLAHELDNNDSSYTRKKPLKESLLESLRKYVQSPHSHSANTPWEFSIDNELIIRTHDKYDRERLIESICATLLDSDIQNHIFNLRFASAPTRAMLKFFKEGLDELIISVELKSSINGKCDICKEWAV